MPRRDTKYMAAKRREILAATKRAARKKGFAHVTFRDITQEAGVSLGAISTHFKTRDDLILAVAGEMGAARTKAFQSGMTAKLLAAFLAAPAAEKELGIDLELLAEARHAPPLKASLQSDIKTAIAALRAPDPKAKKKNPTRLSKDQARLVMALYYGVAAMQSAGQSPSEAMVRTALKSAMATK